MFTKNRIMVFHDDETVMVHLNGQEIVGCIFDKWDSIYMLENLFEVINKLPAAARQRDFTFVSIDADSVDVEDEARDLLYSVQQFTQEEEKALLTLDWKTLNKLLLQRIEDGNIE